MELFNIISDLIIDRRVELVLREPTNRIHSEQLIQPLLQVGLNGATIRKLQNVGNMMVSINPPISNPPRSYTATVRFNNREQLKQVNQMTERTRIKQLENALETLSTYEYDPNMTYEYRAVRTQLFNTLLPKCVNAMGDLSSVIQESAEANGYKVDDFILNSMKKDCKYKLPDY